MTSNKSSLSYLLQELLRVFQECIRYGRICLKTIASKCLKILKWFGSKLVDLIDNEQFWKYSKFIPLINAIFSSARVLRNIYLGKWDEAIKSDLYAAGGIAAILIPIYLGTGCMIAFLLSSAINNVLPGFGSFIVDMWNDESLRTAHWGDMEDVLYERVIKVTPLIGAWYCPIRALVYLIGYGDKRRAKASATDFIINIVSIAVAYVVFQYSDCSQLLGFIEEHLGSVQNVFARVVLNCIKKLLTSDVLTRSAAQCINVGPHIVRDSSLFSEAGFPYYDPNEAKFIHCLHRPYDFIRDDCDNAYMKSHLIQYVVKCLVAGYKNITNEQGNGESVLELAFQGRNPAVLQAVIAFTPTLMERRGKRSARIIERMLNEIDSDSNRCVKYILSSSLRPSASIIDALICCDTHPQYRVIWRQPTAHRPEGSLTGDGTRVLTIDGGGTRGVVSLEILRQIEKLCSDNIRECFDWIVGTSTGGLIALLVADGHRCVEEIQKFYFELKDRVFCGRKGNLFEFERLLKDMFGDRVMGSIPNSTRVVITASLMQNNELTRKVFTNFNQESSDVPIWMVARCTAAAPGYFPTFEHNGELFLDGGLTANNPVFVAFQQLRGQLENSTIVSIGTGIYSDTVPNQSLNVSRSTPGFVRMVRDGSLRQFVDILVNQVTRTDSDIVEDAMLMCEHSRAYFYRLNLILPEKVELNETDDEKLVNTVWHTKVFARNHYSILEEIVDRLIN